MSEASQLRASRPPRVPMHTRVGFREDGSKGSDVLVEILQVPSIHSIESTTYVKAHGAGG
jgi:hypothetical protein